MGDAATDRNLRHRVPHLCDDRGVTDALFELLATGLRSRAESVPELAGLARRETSQVRADLAALQQRGYVELDGDRIRYLTPPAAVAGDVRRQAERLLDGLRRLVGGLVDTTDELPMLIRAWSIGEAGEQAVADIELFHGESAVTDLWHQLLGRHPLRRTDIVLPDASPLFVADPAMQDTWHRVIGSNGNRARVIGSIADVTHPAAQDRIEQELGAGLRIRAVHSPPSWFWVADDSIVAVPLQWGEAWPTTVAAVHSRAVAGLASWAFERLWEQSVGVRGEQATWDPLIQLMCNGASLEAAARALGISERTGRRRIADAMAHYGAPNLVALGVAWGRERRVVLRAPSPS